MGYSCSFYSHKDTLLIKHLESVGRNAQALLMEQGIKDERLLRVAEIIGKAHDFAKYTKFFQEYMEQIRKPVIDTKTLAKNRELRVHAPLSSVYAAWLVDKEIGDDFLTFAALVSVLNHHGSLDLESIEDIQDWMKDFLASDIAQKQLKSIIQNLPVIDGELRSIGLAELQEFVDTCSLGRPPDRVWKALKNIEHKVDNGEIGISEIYILKLLFSVLLSADKSEAAGKERKDRIQFLSNFIDRHRPVSECTDELRQLREEVYKRAHQTLQSLLSGGSVPRIMKITAPTGSGKTATSLSIALRLREYVEKNHGFTPRIIYCLPYINIIEQTYEVIRQSLEKEGLSSKPELLLKHHHLYPPSAIHRDSDAPLEEELLFFDLWDSEIVVTTFVQFFETLLGVRNRTQMKFHKLIGSIIILDETQTIPMELWLLVRRALEALSNHSWIIVMSATSPDMLAGQDSVELVSNYEELYGRVNRVVYRYIDTEFSVRDLASFVVDLWRNYRSLAVVVNTIKASVRLYQEIRSLLGGDVIPIRLEGDEDHIVRSDKPVIAYLSTNIIPKERLRRIELLKGLLKDGRRVLVVCTQVIEAGVDLDFEAVVRDLAPFDSIVQAGGRCNRNGFLGKGCVYIVRLVNDENNPTYSNIYGKLSVEAVTLRLLEPVFEEHQILNKVSSYFRLVNDVKALERSEKSEEILGDLASLYLKRLAYFKLIEETPRVSIFIELDGRAEEVLDEFRRLWSMKSSEDVRRDPYRFRALMRLQRTKLEQYIIETFYEDKAPAEPICPDVDIRYLGRNSLSLYDHETGFRIEDDRLQASFW